MLMNTGSNLTLSNNCHFIVKAQERTLTSETIKGIRVATRCNLHLTAVTVVKRKENTGTAVKGLEPGRKRKNNTSLMHLSCVNSGSSAEVTVH